MYKFRFPIILILSFISSHGWTSGSSGDLWDNYNTVLKNVTSTLKFQGRDGEFIHTAVDSKKLSANPSIRKAVGYQKRVLRKTHPPEKHNEKLAFWINAYNFFTLADIQDHYPVKSMKEIGWKLKHHNVGGREYSLNDIEHNIIRKMGEPRAHFAINCASVGCPSLRRKPYTAENLDNDLIAMTENALKNPMHLRVEKNVWGSESVAATKLFRWFKDDFEVRPYGKVLNFIHQFAPARYKAFDDYSGSISYDWNLYATENIRRHMQELSMEMKGLELEFIQ